MVDKAVGTFLKLDRILGRVLQETEPVEEVLDDLVVDMTKVVDKLEAATQSMQAASTVASISATAVAAAQVCAANTNDPTDDDALERLACEVTLGVADVRSAASLCPDTMQRAPEVMPRLERLLSFR